MKKTFLCLVFTGVSFLSWSVNSTKQSGFSYTKLFRNITWDDDGIYFTNNLTGQPSYSRGSLQFWGFNPSSGGKYYFKLVDENDKPYFRRDVEPEILKSIKRHRIREKKYYFTVGDDIPNIKLKTEKDVKPQIVDKIQYGPFYTKKSSKTLPGPVNNYPGLTDHYMSNVQGIPSIPISPGTKRSFEKAYGEPQKVFASPPQIRKTTDDKFINFDIERNSNNLDDDSLEIVPDENSNLPRDWQIILN